MPYVISIADDLSGAAETAAALAGLPSGEPGASDADPFTGRDADGALRGAGRAVVLSPAPLVLPDRRVVVLDTDSRAVPASEAAASAVAAVGRAFAGAGGDGPAVVFKKLDSMLRGNTTAELRAIAGRWPLVLAPALPVQGRTVADGTLTVGDARHRLADLLPDDTTAPVALRDVRGSVRELTAAIQSALDAGLTAIVDAETDADLDAVARATAEFSRVVLAGSGGLAAAIGRRLPHGGSHAVTQRDGAAPTGLPRRVVTVVGTAETGARRQLEALRDAGVAVHLLAGDALLGGTVRPDDRSDDGDVAYAIDGPMHRDEEVRQRLALALAVHVLAAHPDADLVATGGQTAKALLTVLGESMLFPVFVVHPGAIINMDSTGRVFATRPGSFGSSDSLARMREAVTLLRTRAAPRTTTRKALQ